MRSNLSRALLALLAAGAAAAAGGPSGAPARHLIILSIDGLRPIEYMRADASVARLPVLRDLAARGCASTGLRPVFPSITFPNHTALITGQTPAATGIIANRVFDPLEITPGGLFYFTEHIRVPALWDAVRAGGGTSGALYWPVTVGAPVDFLIPEYKDFRNASEVAMTRALSTPGLLEAIEAAVPLRPGHADDRWRARAAAALFARHKPSLLLLHWIESDEAQHAHAPDTPEARRTLEHLDTLLGELRAAVERAAGGESVAWMIVSDHGFAPYTRQFHPLAVLRGLGYTTYGPGGRVQDWRVFAHITGGTAALVARDPADREAIERTTAHFRHLAADPKFGIRRVYTPADLAERGGFPDSFLGLEMEDGFVAGGATEGPLVTEWATPQGAHGYGSDRPEMLTSWIVSGAGVRRCAAPFEGGSVLDVAPTAAAILGYPFPSAAGNVRTEVLGR